MELAARLRAVDEVTGCRMPAATIIGLNFLRLSSCQRARWRHAAAIARGRIPIA
jgi:hypothetical protein